MLQAQAQITQLFSFHNEDSPRIDLLENEAEHMKTSISNQEKTVAKMDACIGTMNETLKAMQTSTAAQKRLIFAALTGFAGIATLVVMILQWLGGS